MKYILIIIIYVFLGYQSQENTENAIKRIFIILPKNSDSSSKIFYSDKKDISYGALIYFKEPVYKAIIKHTPRRANHPEYKHEEIDITNKELMESTILFAEKLTFMEWSELEQIGLKQKIYMIFEEDYLSKNRFVLDHKFKALEVRVTADGPI
ncbi:hypothetical protein MM213_20430 [Belliella sp. R4-6]|uniref:Uncharacterized protein n=1 Tax=Belliella alkalica TaxID=1730871 RepID=A0ABS9VHG4_9BACT|nr:hypothetical protein [Belliella alkalica]MCH7415879.1 hypothetical protein [Belliella alkalica]